MALMKTVRTAAASAADYQSMGSPSENVRQGPEGPEL